MIGDADAEVVREYLAALDRIWDEYEEAVTVAADKRERLIALAYAEYRGSLALLTEVPTR